jgi:hypothetical protein
MLASVCTVVLNNHAEVYVHPKSVFYGFNVSAQTVAGNLRAILWQCQNYLETPSALTI